METRRLKTVAASGNSSYKYLQNVYSNADVQHQNVTLALAIRRRWIRYLARAHAVY
ncbi:hypothetical protein [Extibacter muris]|uniref:hypothetical protein n=1 Tax=Extibacter muris TaxID=1796622 RepID=UPI00142DCFF7|nr:hypothetical protein [Extibacter muris]